MLFEKPTDAKIIIISTPNCIRCKQYTFAIDGYIDYEVIKLNNYQNIDVIKKEYQINNITELPIYILCYKGNVIYKSNEPISPQWAVHLINLIKKREVT